MIFRTPDSENVVPVNLWLALLVGAILGFVSGLTGIGGGIYLSPLLLVLNWTTMRGSTVIAAGFILINSCSGLIGYLSHSMVIPDGIPILVLCALIGAMVGTRIIIQNQNTRILRGLLGIVLIIAGTKMALT